MTASTHRSSPASRALACLAAGLLAAGCAQLLPRARAEVESPWKTFDDARAAVERIEPYRTTAAQLKALGIDPYATANVQLLTYSDIVLRFPISATFPMEKLDRGLRECLEAGKECTGYAVAVHETKRDRVGNFWADALNFHRVTDITGWSFNALVLVVGGRAVYVTWGGQPMIREQEMTRQPLGPLQGWGEALPGIVR
jgi:hypothetical protein